MVYVGATVQDKLKVDSNISAQAERIEQDLGGIRRALRKPLEAEVAKGELTLPQGAVMREVVRNHGIRLKDLSRAVSLAHSTVSGIVDRLEKRGMIERRPDPADGRLSCIYPTAIVEDWMRERLPVLNQGPLQSALQRATAEDRVAIGEALRRLRNTEDGDVEVVASGSAEDLAELRASLREGPRGSRVDRVIEHHLDESEAQDLTTFRIEGAW